MIRVWPALALMACGCGIDQRAIVGIPDPIVIDRFEGMNTLPDDPRFGQWQHNLWGADTEMRHFGALSPGFNSGWCMRFEYEVTDAPDGVSSIPSFIVVTDTPGAIDLTGYTHVSLAHRYRHEGSCGQLTGLTVSVQCTALNTFMQASLPISAEWVKSDVALTELQEPSWAHHGVRLEDCLRVADGISLRGATSAPDGQCSSGTLEIDDVVIYSAAGGDDRGSDGGTASDAGTSPACTGSPPLTPLIIGSADSPTGPLFAFAAPGLTAPTVTPVTAAGNVVRALDVAVNPGTPAAGTSSYLGFGLSFGNPSCVDASAFTGVTFTVTGDLGTCALTFGAITSEDNAVANSAYGRCTASNCYPPTSRGLSTGTSVVLFSQLSGGSPVSTVDAAALNGVQWILNVPTDGVTAPCVANFTISDVAFVNDTASP